MKLLDIETTITLGDLEGIPCTFSADVYEGETIFYPGYDYEVELTHCKAEVSPNLVLDLMGDFHFLLTAEVMESIDAAAIKYIDELPERYLQEPAEDIAF